jgi:2-hydroxychromene-2-carboxylate isomerase
MQLDFFYDLSSPWTYLAFNNIQPIIKETGAAVRWRPFLVGGVFNAVNPGFMRRVQSPLIRRSFITFDGYTNGLDWQIYHCYFRPSTIL